MDIWIPLISACIGGLLATIPILISNLVQIYLHGSEKRQRQREAKTQLALELMRNDIKILDESIDNELRVMIIITDFSIKRWDKKLPVEEMKEQIKSAILDEKGRINQLDDAYVGAEKIACSLGGEIYSEYKRFGDLMEKYWDLVVNNASVWDELATLKKQATEQKSYSEVISSAAKLHTMLRDKLISLRDT